VGKSSENHIFWEFSAVIKEPSPGQHVAGIIEHMLPFAAVTAELWRVIVDKLIEQFSEMREADLRVMSGRPERLDTRPDRDAAYERLRDRTATLLDAVDRAESLPTGWFGWTSTSKRRAAAIVKAEAELDGWEMGGSLKFMQSEAARLEKAVRRQDGKIAGFDRRPEVVSAARRLDDYPGALRLLEGVREIQPDKELHEVMRPVVRQDGTVLRVNGPAALALLRRRTAIAAATRAAEAGKSGGGPVNVPVPEPEIEADDRPEMDGEMDVPPGLLM
jgi:hypothetical protein